MILTEHHFSEPAATSMLQPTQSLVRTVPAEVLHLGWVTLVEVLARPRLRECSVRADRTPVLMEASAAAEVFRRLATRPSLAIECRGTYFPFHRLRLASHRHPAGHRAAAAVAAGRGVAHHRAVAAGREVAADWVRRAGRESGGPSRQNRADEEPSPAVDPSLRAGPASARQALL